MGYLEFIELPSFRKSWRENALDDEDLRELQCQILENPEAGSSIGHLRKVRFASNSHGKSGGSRVIYVFVRVRSLVFLIFCYPKNKKENLTQEEQITLKNLAKKLMDAALQK